MTLHDFLHTELATLEAQHLRRVRRVLDSAQGAQVQVDGQTLHNFCSNDYLGLASHPVVTQAFIAGAKRWGVGSGASHLVTGHSRAHDELEQQLAAFTGREAALTFSTGFMANVGTINALLGRGDRVLQYRLNHASLIDGGVSSGARFKRYGHNDLNALGQLLADAKANNHEKSHTLVVTDSVFSMDGDLAPLPEIAGLCAQQHAWLMVDDAHGFGVLGAHGRGCVEHFGLNQEQLPILMCTLGKAIGTYGAFVAGSRDLIDYLVQKARPYIYSTAMPAAVACATSAAITLLETESWRRAHLQNLIAGFVQRAQRYQLPLLPSMTAIQPLLLGDNAQCLTMAARLRARGFLISAIRPPTVPVGSARLRITLSAAHDIETVAQLVDVLADTLQELRAEAGTGSCVEPHSELLPASPSSP